MYMHDECVGSRGIFAKIGRDPTHSSCIQSMKIKSIKTFDATGGQAIFRVFSRRYSDVERILFSHLGRTLFDWVVVRDGQPLLVYFMLAGWV